MKKLVSVLYIISFFGIIFVCGAGDTLTAQDGNIIGLIMVLAASALSGITAKLLEVFYFIDDEEEF